MLLDGGYGERQSKLAEEQSRRGNGRTTVAMRLFIARKGLPGDDSARTDPPRHQLRVKA